MAQKTVIIYTDDVTGEETSEVLTHSLILDGVAYEIDLGAESYDSLLEAVTPFTSRGRRVRTGTQLKAASVARGNDATAIRAWAKAQGLQVSERGRIPRDVREKYEAARSR
ncbi:histone-like nucleoid-structuring protein Lsr2 [Streptomyces vinaceus]